MLPFDPGKSYATGIRAYVHIPTPASMDISSCSRVRICDLPFIIQSLLLTESVELLRQASTAWDFPSHCPLFFPFPIVNTLSDFFTPSLPPKIPFSLFSFPDQLY